MSTLAALDTTVVDLDQELQRLLSLVQFMREALQKRVVSGMGYKQESVAKEDLQALKELATVFSTATDCQVRLDKTAEIRAKKLDKAGYLRLANKLVMSLPPSERGLWIKKLLMDHRESRGNASGLHKIDSVIAKFDEENPDVQPDSL